MTVVFTLKPFVLIWYTDVLPVQSAYPSYAPCLILKKHIRHYLFEIKLERKLLRLQDPNPLIVS